MSGLRWETPPPTGNNKSTLSMWGPVCDALEARAGEWAVVYEQSDDHTTVQARNKKNSLMGFAFRHKLDLETVSRQVNGRIVMYARVVKAPR